jgi:DNA polymerase-3 subunit gamma/tau
MEKSTHKILALKYRPKNFKELIGQEIMVETITNSIKQNKLPNAYLLTGIRGTGKTTTARLIAKALNCNKDFLIEENCTCNNCEEIANSKHLDVLEMDAASRTGIDDVRELIESSKYNPTSAKYKIFIIDEVHMLSKQAFNGLLKTLEETPPRCKFIFATTEIKKIPVTIVSRCQRFDLHRIQIKDLVSHLEKILKIEKGRLTKKALILIAKASEGSVRDSLSLLDRALVSQNIEDKEIDEFFVRKMLGIADRSKILILLDFIFKGDQKKSLEQLKEMIKEGVEPNNFLNDLLEIIYFIQQKKSIGNIDSDLSISESEEEIINEISKNINVSTLIIFWQLILKVLDELSIVASPILSLEMLVVRLVQLKHMPTYEKVLDEFKKNNSNKDEKNNTSAISINEDKKSFSTQTSNIVKTSKDQIKNLSQAKPELSPKLKNFEKGTVLEKVLSFEDLILLASKKKEINLKYDLVNNVNLVKFSQGKMNISLNVSLDKDFVRNLSEKLFEWTGNRWLITLVKEEGQKTFLEQKNTEKKELIDKEKKGKIYDKFKKIFSDAELLEVKKDN